MNTKNLIDLAKNKSGMSLGLMAEELGVRQERITEWKNGKFAPSAGVLAYFAEKADLPVLQTVAEIEVQLDNRFAHIWAKALGNLRAAGVAAMWMFGLAISLTMPTNDAQATTTAFTLQGSQVRNLHRPPI